MKRKCFSVGRIIRMLREVEVDLSQDKSVAEMSRELGTTDQTYYG